MAINSINANALNSSTLIPEVKFVAPNSTTAKTPEPNLNTPDFESKQSIADQKLAREIMDKLSSVDQSSTEKKETESSIKDFINNKLIATTTVISALANIMSAPVHMFDEKNPLRKIINNVSLLLTKGHLITYGISGLTTAFEQKNPFLVFSFLTEALCAGLGLRKIYLVRGIATGVDGAIAAIKKRSNITHYANFMEGFKHTFDQFKEVCKEMTSNQSKLMKFDAVHTTVLSSIMMVFGAIFGVTVNDKLGGWIRDVAGGFNDLGLSKLDEPNSNESANKQSLDSKDARRSGWLYFGGTVFDFVARIFNDSIASVLGIKETEAFNRLRDVFHELALAFDRGGQYYFLKFNQKKSSEPNLEPENKSANSFYDLHSAPARTKEHNFASAA